MQCSYLEGIRLEINFCLNLRLKKKELQQEAEDVPWKSTSTSLRTAQDTSGRAAAREQGDQQVPVYSWGTIKPFYKLSQE